MTGRWPLDLIEMWNVRLARPLILLKKENMNISNCLLSLDLHEKLLKLYTNVFCYKNIYVLIKSVKIEDWRVNPVRGGGQRVGDEQPGGGDYARADNKQEFSFVRGVEDIMVLPSSNWCRRTTAWRQPWLWTGKEMERPGLGLALGSNFWREIDHQWTPDGIIQLNHIEAGWLLWWRGF